MIAAIAAPCSRSPPTTRAAASSRPAPTARCKIWNAGLGHAGAHHRARRGPRDRARRRRSTAPSPATRAAPIVLWDLERAEKLGALPAPAGARLDAGLHRRRQPVRRRERGRRGDAVRRRAGPSAPTPLSRPRTAPCSWPAPAPRRSWSRPARTAPSGCGARIPAAWRAAGAARARHSSALGISPGGRTVASGSAAGSVRLWSTSSSRLQRAFKAHQGRVTSLAFAPNDRLLASAGEDGQVKVWDLRSRRAPRVLRGHAGPVNAVAFFRRRPAPALRRRRTAPSASGAAPWCSRGNSPPSSRRRAGPSHIRSVAMPSRCMGPVPLAPRWQRGACTG